MTFFQIIELSSLLLLVSAPLVAEVGTGACCRLPDGRGWCLPTGRWSWFLSLWWVGLCLWVRLEAAVCLGGSLGSLFTDWQGYDPFLDYHLAWGFSALMSGARFPQNGHLQRNTHCWIFPRAFPLMPFPHNKPQSPPVFPGDPPRTAIRSNPDSCGDSVLPLNPVHMKVCVHISRMGCPLPQVPWGSCTQAPLAFNVRCSGGSFSQCQIPRHGDLMWGSELTPVGESLWYSYFPVCGASYPGYMGLLVSHNHPSYLLMWPPLCLLE